MAECEYPLQADRYPDEYKTGQRRGSADQCNEKVSPGSHAMKIGCLWKRRTGSGDNLSGIVVLYKGNQFFAACHPLRKLKPTVTAPASTYRTIGKVPDDLNMR